MFTIQQATVAQCELIRSLAQQTFPATYSGILTPEQINYMMEWMYATQNIRRQMEEQGHIYLLAYRDGQPVGYASIEQQEENLFHLQKIYVLPTMQGTGCGAFLFGHVIACIKEMHPTPCLMELNVNRQNPARNFYERMGMHILREGDFDIGNGYFMNDYIMGIEVS